MALVGSLGGTTRGNHVFPVVQDARDPFPFPLNQERLRDSWPCAAVFKSDKLFKPAGGNKAMANMLWPHIEVLAYATCVPPRKSEDGPRGFSGVPRRGVGGGRGARRRGRSGRNRASPRVPRDGGCAPESVRRHGRRAPVFREARGRHFMSSAAIPVRSIDECGNNRGGNSHCDNVLLHWIFQCRYINRNASGYSDFSGVAAARIRDWREGHGSAPRPLCPPVDFTVLPVEIPGVAIVRYHPAPARVPWQWPVTAAREYFPKVLLRPGR